MSSTAELLAVKPDDPMLSPAGLLEMEADADRDGIIETMQRVATNWLVKAFYSSSELEKDRFRRQADVHEWATEYLKSLPPQSRKRN